MANSATDVSVGFRPPCFFLIRMVSIMASPYKSLLILWKHFFGYLVYEIFLWPESWRGSLHIYLFSFPRFWTLSIELFWFLFWSISSSKCCLSQLTPQIMHTNIGKARRQQSVRKMLTELVWDPLMALVAANRETRVYTFPSDFCRRKLRISRGREN